MHPFLSKARNAGKTSGLLDSTQHSERHFDAAAAQIPFSRWGPSLKSVLHVLLPVNAFINGKFILHR